MSIPSAWPQVLDFFGTPLVIEPSPGQLSKALLAMGAARSWHRAWRVTLALCGVISPLRADSKELCGRIGSFFHQEPWTGSVRPHTCQNSVVTLTAFHPKCLSAKMLG